MQAARQVAFDIAFNEWERQYLKSGPQPVRLDAAAAAHPWRRTPLLTSWYLLYPENHSIIVSKLNDWR